MRGARVATVFFSVLFALLVFSFFRLYERVEETIDIGYSEEARRNPYLAAQEYLSKVDRNVEAGTEMTLIDSLGMDETLFITNASTVRSEKRVQQLLDWVASGGRLILAVSEEDVPSNRGMISALGIEVEFIPAVYPRFQNCAQLERSKKRRQRSSNSDDETSVGEALEQLNQENNDRFATDPDTAISLQAEQCLDKKYQTRLEFSNVSDPFYVHFPGVLGFSWDEEHSLRPFYFAEDEAGVRFAQIEWGGGLISLLASPVVWRSSNIGLFDNAYLMWALSERGSRFHILYGSAMPSLFHQIWKHGYEFIIASLLAVLIWIWYVGKRVQPFRDPQITQRRSVLEHIEARAEYLWKNAEYDAVIAPLREDILQKCKLRIPTFYQAGPDQKIQLISNATDLDKEVIQQLFSQTSCSSASQCQKLVQTAQRIRNRI